MKITLFGGSGFVGGHVAEALHDAGHRVRVFDLKPSSRLRPGQEMIRGDILDEKAVARAVAGQDAVFNFAGFADIEAAQSHPLETIRLNVLGNGILLEACRRAKVKRYLFASTMYVYGGMASFYRASKLSCEAYIEAYQRIYGLPYTILRFGSLYGPRADERNGIYGFLHQALTKKSITYWGDGEEIREYIHVRDAAESCVDALAKKHENACLILTGHQSMKIRDLLAMIREILGNKVRLIYKSRSRPDLRELHYRMTPYAYLPQEARKLVRSHYVDLGQGLLGALDDVRRRLDGPEKR
jgi:UDP-glucose 4-epimerase